MEPEDTPPSQPTGEKIRMRTMWAVLGVASVAFSFYDAPYPLSVQSPILVKGELVEHIKVVRSEGEYWPNDATDPLFRPGPLVRREASPPQFGLVSVDYDKTDPSIEYGVYTLQFRGDKQRLRVRFDPGQPIAARR